MSKSLEAEDSASGDLEVTQTKGSREENFPVGSLLISRSLRPHVATFYALARATDDIADSADLTPDEKLSKLERFERALTGENQDDRGASKAYAVVRSCQETGVEIRHSVDLIHAFKLDATKQRYEDWTGLMAYCSLSAAPVGRFLLDLHGEKTSAYSCADALCNVLQVLNHLQDLQNDYQELNRIYLPLDWMSEFDVSIEDLGKPVTTPGLRCTIDRCLDGCSDLMSKARLLPEILQNRRLAMESAVIVQLADRLSMLLRKNDPIARRIDLTKRDFLECSVRGAIAHVFGGFF